MTYDQAEDAAGTIRRTFAEPLDAAIVLGSGLDPLAARVVDPIVLQYTDLPHFPRTSVAGHAGRLLLGTLAGRRIAVFQGRFHFYEGHGLDIVTFPVRVMARLGVPRLILTAATGGIRDDLPPGSIMALSDHLNLLGASPLRGPNDERFGPRFPDLSAVYSPTLRAQAAGVAAEIGHALAEGVYAAVLGPNYETPAEIRMLRTLGADVVGMSTVPEAIVARQCGIEVLALAVVANRAAGLSTAPLSHQDVLDVVRGVAVRLADLIESLLPRIAPQG